MGIKMVNTHVVVNDELIDNGDVQEIINPVWYSVSIYDGEQQYNADLQAFSLPQRNIFAVMWYIAEVNNGGHDQFFSNSTGIVWKDALEGFRAAGLAECAEILSEAVQLMGGNPSPDREKRWEIMDKLEPDFEEPDRRFYRLPDETILGKLHKYICDNRESFYFEGDMELPDFSGMLSF